MRLLRLLQHRQPPRLRAALALVAFLLVLVARAVPARAEPVLHVGSKRFTESYVLAEIVRTAAENAGEAKAEHHQGLGNTGIVFAALKSGSIDVYAEYTGTIVRELLGHKDDANSAKEPPSDLASLNRELAPLGLTAGVPLGFNDTYALAMRSETAQKLGVRTLSELAPHAELRFGFSQEFLERADGWPALTATYGMKAQRPRAIEHALAYKALVNGDIDVVDVYSTDPKIAEEHLAVLGDDKQLFPRYDAVLLYRSDLPGRLPKTWAALSRLAGSIDEMHMTRMNADAEVRGLPFDAIARAFLSGGGQGPAAARPSFFARLFGGDFLRLTGEHLLLVAISVAFGTLAGVPLGIWAAYRRGATQPILGAVGILQTIPSLALLAFLIPILHRIGIVPALVALFLYSLLPIVRNTYTGLSDIAPSLRESALALGLPRGARLRLVELPLASRAIVAGVKTSTVISVGTATIAAFIGAGGYGERIASGLALSDNDLLLAGAIPAAGMALLFEAFFGLVERWIIPRPLRG